MKVAILGVGLIGGSIGLAARRHAEAHVTGYDPDEGVRARALGLGALDAAAGDVAAAVAGADVVFVAAPVGVLPAAVAEALAHAGSDCVVSDVGSTKRMLAAAGADERFVGGHPLAGAETAGVEHARADLFEGATWYLTPAASSTAGVLYERLYGLLRRLGAHPSAIDADTHDRLMANISHLPHVLANVLVSQAAHLLSDGEPDGEEQARLPAVGPSFRDAIRVAGANSRIWTDIYLSNRDALGAAIDDLSAALARVRADLEHGRGPELASWNDAARRDRDALLGAVGGTEGTVHELRVAVPNRPGVVADVALALGRAGVNIQDMALSPSPDKSQGVIALWIAGEQQTVLSERLIGELGLPVARA